MTVILLILGTILTVLFVVFLIKGQKYNYMTESLCGDDFPLPSIYCAGLAMQDYKIWKAPPKLASAIRRNTKLMYSRQYSEYYYRVIWAQALSFGLLGSALCFVIAGIVPDMASLLALLGVIMLVLPGYYFINHISSQITDRRSACNQAFPNAISKLALIVNSGVILHEAWAVVAYGNNGEFYDLMQKACQEMENGKTDIDAIIEFGIQTDSDDIKKFTSILAQSIERGGGELPSFLSNQSKELWAHHRQVMLQKGEKAAGALLMPIALMFLGVMLIVIAAAMQSFAM